MAASYVSILLPTVLFVLLVFPLFGLYRSWRGQGVAMEVGRLLLAWLTVLLLLVISEWATRSSSNYSRLWMLGWSMSTILVLGIYRWVARHLLGRIRMRGMDVRKVVVVGATHAGRKIVETVRNNPWMGLDVVGSVETPYDQIVMDDIPVLGHIDAFIEGLRQNVPDQIWIALPLRAEAMIQQLLDVTSEIPTTVRLVPDLFGYELLNQGATEIAGVPVITLQGSRVDGHAQVIKALEDRVLSALILVLITPLLLLLAIGVKISSPGPVLFRQERHGLGGKVVEVWKFRTMRVHQETEGQVTQATRGDPRVTRFGRFLRASSFDELPQFINVLQGRMSIVGPRPHAVEHNNHYQNLVWRYMQRHSVKPGITGLAQINGCRGETDALEKMAKRVEYDLAYIRNWSLWLDLRIIAITAVRGFFDKNSY
jgi:Undecaprenyl-phosphate glucose phosphotransferase